MPQNFEKAHAASPGCRPTTFAHWKLLRDPHDAEDAVQDAFLRAYRAFGRVRGDDGRAWLLTIVRNTCYSRMRSNPPRARRPRRSTTRPTALPLDRSERPTRSTGARPGPSCFSRGAGKRLPTEYREVIVLHEVEGLAYREISEVAEIPLGTVMSRLSRARSRLQAELLGPYKKEKPHGL